MWFGFQDFEKVGLGMGFGAIYVIDRLYRGKTHWWPLIPAIVLIGSELIAGSRQLERVISRGWPLALVVVGVLILLGVFSRSRERDSR